MSLIVRIVLIVSGAIAALFVARDALHFPIVTGVVAILLIALVVIAAGLIKWRRQSDDR